MALPTPTVILKARNIGFSKVVQARNDLSQLFPQRLKTKAAHWTIARQDTKCNLCGDDVLEGERVAVKPGEKGVACMYCGVDLVEAQTVKDQRQVSSKKIRGS